MSPGTLYPWLEELVQQELITREERVVDGKQRKYYRITEKGNQFLNRIRAFLIELYDEIIENH